MPSTLLHGLPESASQNILRYLSLKPSMSNWTRFLKVKDKLTAMHPSNPLRDAALPLFTGINALYDPLLAATWFEYAGESLTELTFATGLKGADPEAVALMLDSLERNFLALRCLDISKVSKFRPDVAKAFLKKSRGRLHHLVTHCMDVTGASPVGIYCSGLQNLVLEDSPRNLRDIVRLVGPSLKSIAIKGSLSKPQMRLIEKRCPHLSSISLDAVSGEYWANYADLLCSYGSQLQFAGLSRAPTSVCEHVVRFCPNMRCDVGRVREDVNALLARMKGLGSCVKRAELNLYSTTGALNTTFFEEAVRACTKLEHMYFSGKLSTLKMQFCQEMSRLTSIELRIFDLRETRRSDSRNLFWKLSACAGQLRELVFYGYSQDEGTFQAFARNNPDLRKVDMHFEDGGRWRDLSRFYARVEDAVTAFLECPNLCELQLLDKKIGWKKLDSVANHCRRAQLKRNHPLYVDVLRVQYLV